MGKWKYIRNDTYRNCGIKYSDESEEAFTYLYEFFLDKALSEKGYKNY